MSYFKVLSKHSFGVCKENHEKRLSRWIEARSRFEPPSLTTIVTAKETELSRVSQ
jgi:hypothetical protein